MSGRPGSNWPPSRWQRDALPNELLPLETVFSSHLAQHPVNQVLDFEPRRYVGRGHPYHTYPLPRTNSVRAGDQARTGHL